MLPLSARCLRGSPMTRKAACLCPLRVGGCSGQRRLCTRASQGASSFPCMDTTTAASLQPHSAWLHSGRTPRRRQWTDSRRSAWPGSRPRASGAGSRKTDRRSGGSSLATLPSSPSRRRLSGLQELPGGARSSRSFSATGPSPSASSGSTLRQASLLESARRFVAGRCPTGIGMLLRVVPASQNDASCFCWTRAAACLARSSRRSTAL
mmetsp:Transcript_25372/g.60338  ORF Transcript_25372/g.60338 Transcript_25372/m.60338 type:complete len:208 (+) Transcript_25372:2423-3046(+)